MGKKNKKKNNNGTAAKARYSGENDSKTLELSDKQEALLSDYCALAGCFYIGGSLLLFLFFCFCRVDMIAMAAIVFLIAGAGDFAQRRKKKFRQTLFRQSISDIVVFLIVIYVVAGNPASLYSRDMNRYNGYKIYLNGLLDTEDLFPYELPESIDFLSYKLVNKNKAWGKSTWSSVRFRVDTDSAEWAKMVYEKYTRREETYEETHYEGTLEECLNGNTTSENLRFLCDRDFWEGYEKDTFVMSDLNSGTDSKPVSKVIIINPKEGMIEFSQLNKPFFKI